MVIFTHWSTRVILPHYAFIGLSVQWLRSACYHCDMCSHYQAIKERERYIKHFGVEPPTEFRDAWSSCALALQSCWRPVRKRRCSGA